MLRVVAIEDDARYRSSLEMLLRYSSDFMLVRAFDAADHALAALRDSLDRGEVPLWDLVLMDLDLPRLGGVECTRRIKELLPDVTIVVLTVFEDRAAVLDAICAGADGYLLKHTPGDQLIAIGEQPFEIRKPDVERIVSWSEGVLIFEDEPLDYVVSEINRYSLRKIVLGAETMKDLRIGGVFEPGSVAGFTAALEKTFPLTSEIDESRNVIVLRWRDSSEPL